MPTSTSEDPRRLIRERAEALGFDAVGFASVDQPWPAGGRLAAFVEAGRHGTMDWIRDTLERRSHPRSMWPEARTAIVLGVSYGPDRDPLEILAQKDRAAISVYAQGDDYHELIKGRLKQLGGWMASRLGGRLKVFVDTAPLMEKPLAQAAGLGWQGKHTNLVSREHGSWLFLGAVLAGDRALVLDGQVGEAGPGVELEGRGEGVGRADVEAGAAGAAVFGLRSVRLQLKVGEHRAQEQP